ncbi:MAG: hypothetical protein CSA94_01515 [Bacteroidetes bacterium]|nr:MAG: hypothetical protein CSA94_01515 [Bacteroidota bacterium]
MNIRGVIALCLTLVFIQGCKQDRKTSFSIPKDVIEIPFEYSSAGFILTKGLVEKDTMDFIVDTGSTLTYIPYSTDIKDVDTVLSVLDAAGIKKDVSKVLVKDIKWGSLGIKNLSCGINEERKDFGIIGGDVLRNFCVRIDNVKSKIILSKNTSAMKGDRVISVPFKMDERNSIEILGSLETSTPEENQTKEYSFLFDTGSTFEIVFQGEELLPSVREEQKWEIIYNSAFSEEGYTSDATFFLADFRLKDCLFHNIVGMSATQMKNLNPIGTVFIRRFESITIDYSNKVLYFKLPRDSKTLKFPTTNIKNAPTSHFVYLCNTLASLGIRFSGEKPCVVEGVREEWKDLIAINDTLVGINNTIFNKDAWDFIKNQGNKLLTDSLEFNQDPILQIPMVIGSRVRFLFLKNKKLVTIDAKRKSYLLPKDFVYSFLGDNDEWAYFSINSVRDSLSNYSFHYPWASLIQYKKEFQAYKGGKKIVKTNEFKVKKFSRE